MKKIKLISKIILQTVPFFFFFPLAVRIAGRWSDVRGYRFKISLPWITKCLSKPFLTNEILIKVAAGISYEHPALNNLLTSQVTIKLSWGR